MEASKSRAAVTTHIPVLLTKKETADLLRVSIPTLQRWMRDGLIRFYKVGPKDSTRFHREDVLAQLRIGGLADINNSFQLEDWLKAS